MIALVEARKVLMIVVAAGALGEASMMGSANNGCGRRFDQAI